MARGRKPISREQKLLRGTLQPCRDRGATVMGPTIEQLDIRVWTNPGYSSLTARAKDIYKRACRQLISMKMLQAPDLNSLIAYAREYDLYLQAVEDVNTNGRKLYYEDKNGFPRYYDNPAIHQANNALANLRALGSNFGFSPVDRQRLKSAVDDSKTKGIKAMFAAILMDDEPEIEEQ